MIAGDLIILGSGGHARTMVDACACLELRVTGCLSMDAPDAAWDQSIPWLGGDEMFDRLDAKHAMLLNGLGSIMSTDRRTQPYLLATAKGFQFCGLRHPSAFVSGTAHIASDVVIMAGCIIQTNAVVGENALINSGALVEHDCVVGAHAHIASRAALAGGVRVGEGAHIGLNASIRQGVSVGARSTVGAGAVVVSDVADGATVAGAPARPLEFRTAMT